MQKEYWDTRWKNDETGWDIGYVSTPIKEYIDQVSDKSLRILVPGCGNAYEAEYLYEQGFVNTFIVEIAELAVNSFSKRYPKFPKEQIIIADFFKLEDQFDMILEQTFFCAIEPRMRNSYAQQAAALLKPGGKLVGLLFNRNFEGGPPFGGSRSEYVAIFSPYFQIQTMETAINSILPRKNTELFIKLIKK